MSPAEAERRVVAFNRDHPVGTPVTFWPGAKRGPGTPSTVREKAFVLSRHTPVVYVSDHGSCLALTHVEKREASEPEIVRGDVGLAECTRDPIFLLQSRRWHVGPEGLPPDVVWDADATDFRRVSPKDPDDAYLTMSAIAEEFPSSVREEWRTERVFFTREEGDSYGKARAYNYPEGWRVYCVCAEGQLAELLRAHSVRPTGIVDPEGGAHGN